MSKKRRPIPEKLGDKYDLASLLPGDVRVAPLADRYRLRAAAAYRKNTVPGWRFMTRTDEHEVILWRLDDAENGGQS